MERYYIPLSEVINPDALPFELFDTSEDGLFSAFEFLDTRTSTNEFGVDFEMDFRATDAVTIPLLPFTGIDLLVGAPDPEDPDSGEFRVNCSLSRSRDAEIPEDVDDLPEPDEVLDRVFDEINVGIEAELFHLRIDRGLLKPVQLVQDGDGVVTHVFPEEGDMVLALGDTVLEVSYTEEEWDFHFALAANDGLDLPPCEIGNTGIYMTFEGLRLNMDGAFDEFVPEGAPSNWKGLFAESGALYMPDLFPGSIEISDFGIGQGGVFGEVRKTFPLSFNAGTKAFEGDLAGGLLGLKGGISAVEITFVQNVPTQIAVQGQILLPFFETVVDVEVEIGMNGDIYVALAETDDEGILSFEKEGLLSFELEALSFSKEGERLWMTVSGVMTPLVEGLDWPDFRIEGLGID
ncbi:MAG: hypothetical protein AAF570_25505, partial [Bacteroidota bacterium]